MTNLKQFKEESRKRFREEFVSMRSDNQREFINSLWPEKHETFLSSELDRLVEVVVGEIGAKLLAKHSTQAVLDVYFDSANEVLEQNEINN